MAWRDEIASCTENGDVDGALRIFDELWSDRERVRTLNTAYLQHIAELKSGQPAEVKGAPKGSSGRAGEGVLEQLGRACADLRKALKAL